jgi:hypothetical protein
MNEILEQQIIETMKKAFWDLIRDDLNAEPQRFDHLLKLIVEIRERLKNLTPRRADFINELNEKLDIDFLKHLFVEKGFDPFHFYNLVVFIIKKIKQYAAPYFDKDILDWEKHVLLKMKNTIEYKDFIPEFFEKVYYYIDIIENDTHAFNARR